MVDVCDRKFCLGHDQIRCSTFEVMPNHRQQKTFRKVKARLLRVFYKLPLELFFEGRRRNMS
jgi:hypothetical protein